MPAPQLGPQMTAAQIAALPVPLAELALRASPAVNLCAYCGWAIYPLAPCLNCGVVVWLHAELANPHGQVLATPAASAVTLPTA